MANLKFWTEKEISIVRKSLKKFETKQEAAKNASKLINRTTASVLQQIYKMDKADVSSVKRIVPKGTVLEINPTNILFEKGKLTIMF